MREYPLRLAHAVPGWVKPGSIYHIRIRVEQGSPLQLVDPALGRNLLNSAELYHRSGRWFCLLFLLMPDHLHALLAFPPRRQMGDVVGDWKGFQTKRHGVDWQGNFFDHRIRSKRELDEKAAYIRNNPVVKALCARAEDWPWVFCGGS